MSVDIGFVNDEGIHDETQFDISPYDWEELIRLYSAFCEENNYPKNTVTGIVIVRMADAMDEL